MPGPEKQPGEVPDRMHAVMAQNLLVWRSYGFDRVPRFVVTEKGLEPESRIDFEQLEAVREKLGEDVRLPMTIIDPNRLRTEVSTGPGRVKEIRVPEPPPGESLGDYYRRKDGGDQ